MLLLLGLAPVSHAAEPWDAASVSQAAAGNWTIADVDDDPQAGHGVVAHSLGPGSAIVVHKRFYDIDPENEYAPAELVALRTEDGGATWDETVIDASAPENAAGLGAFASIAVDGVGDDVYVAYHERDSGAWSDMRLHFAHSADRGATWDTGLVVDGFAGDFVGLAVVDPSTAVASYHGESQAQGLWVAITSDSGQTWQTRHVNNATWTGFYSSVDAPDASRISVSHGTGDLAVARSLDGGQAWTEETVAQDAGAGTDIAVPSNRTAYVAYEGLDPVTGIYSAFVAVTHDGEATWNRTALEAGAGWNHDVETIGEDQASVSYWGDDDGLGRARLVTTINGGQSWAIDTVPEDEYVLQNLDLAAEADGSAFVAYQVQDLATGARGLRVARLGPSLPPPPDPEPVILLSHAFELGLVGGQARGQLPFTLGGAYSDVSVTISCPASAGDATLASPSDPLGSSLLAVCAAGDAHQSVPQVLPAGDYLLEVAAAGSGRFTVLVTGLPVP